MQPGQFINRFSRTVHRRRDDFHLIFAKIAGNAFVITKRVAGLRQMTVSIDAEGFPLQPEFSPIYPLPDNGILIVKCHIFAPFG